jgi:hypothetical protein
MAAERVGADTAGKRPRYDGYRYQAAHELDSASSHEDTPPCRRNGARRHAAGAPGNGAAKEVRDPGMAAIELTETVLPAAPRCGWRSGERNDAFV